jgi:hypothetical protein
MDEGYKRARPKLNWKGKNMITNQQLVINNLEEKLKVFTYAVSGELIKEEDSVIEYRNSH